MLQGKAQSYGLFSHEYNSTEGNDGEEITH